VPVAPVAPCGPVAPVAPIGPCTPVAPVAPGGPVAPVAPLTAVFQVISCSLPEQLANNVVGGGEYCRMRTLPLPPCVVFTHAVTLVTVID
jgi:hypothetical protein